LNKLTIPNVKFGEQDKLSSIQMGNRATIMKIVSRFLLVLMLLFAAPANIVADSDTDILIIVNKVVPVNSLSIDDVRDLFLKKKVRWKAGVKAVPINIRGKEKLRNQFRSRVLGMTLGDENDYWQKMKIQSGMSAPTEIGNTLKAVYKLKGAVSYIYRSQYKKDVAKIVLTIPAS
jgi:ABC-type phosphate transport system substrate-binding protein